MSRQCFGSWRGRLATPRACVAGLTRSAAAAGCDRCRVGPDGSASACAIRRATQFILRVFCCSNACWQAGLQWRVAPGLRQTPLLRGWESQSGGECWRCFPYARLADQSCHGSRQSPTLPRTTASSLRVHGHEARIAVDDFWRGGDRMKKAHQLSAKPRHLLHLRADDRACGIPAGCAWRSPARG